MAELTPAQRRSRQRVEGVIALAAPVLDLVLAVGDRVSRIAASGEHEPRPVRPAGQPALIEPPRGSGTEAGDGGRA